MYSELLSNINFIFDTLENSGFECYAVGGCVRDILLGNTPNDVDFTTNATPDEILECFKNYQTYELGKKFGTICVHSNGKIYEITTYRIDGEYTDSRHPDAVTFSRNLKDDLARRDFTINAMAMDKYGNITDLFGGKADLENKVVRTVGEAENRFAEDALRIIRAIRFSAKLGFSIEENTVFACHKLKDTLNRVHPQRLNSELSSILLSENPSTVLYEYKDVFSVIIPELSACIGCAQNTVHHRYDVFNHTLKALEYSPADLEIRMALLFHDIGKPICKSTDSAGINHFNGHPRVSASIAKEILSRFSYPAKFINTVTTIIELHDKRFEKLRTHIKRALIKLGEDKFEKLLIVQKCDVLAQSEFKREEKLKLINTVRMEASKIISENACLKLSDLKLNGRDIINLGAEGSLISSTLNYLLDLVIREHIENNYDQLMKEAKQYLSSVDKS